MNTRMRTIALITGLLAVASTARADWPLPPAQTGLLYIAGWGSNNVGAFHPDGTHVRTLTVAGLTQPRGIAVDETGSLVVVTEQSSKIFVLDLDGTVRRTVTHPLLTAGTGIGRAPNGNWYVGNFSPGRVVVFDSGWNFVSTLAQSGMTGVNCVSFDASGDFAVSAASTNTLYRFDSSHTLLGTVRHGSISSPMSIAFDSTGRVFLSNGGGVVTRFDASWNALGTFGQGAVAAPQGIVVDENDLLTISNFSSSLVHRYDTSGNLLGSFSLSGGVSVARNLAFQTNLAVLARNGSVNRARSFPETVLTVRGRTADAMGRVALRPTDPLTIDIVAPSAGPTPCPFVLYLYPGEPTAADVAKLPARAGWTAFRTPLDGGNPIALMNSVGLASVLGASALPPIPAPGQVISLPGGLGGAATFTLQALMLDAGSRGAPAFSVSASNAVVLLVR